MTLCQNIILQIGSRYRLSFDLFTTVRWQKMFGRVYLNDNFLSSMYIMNKSTFQTLVYSFYANQSFNTFCFNETHSAAPPFSYMPSSGGIIDNISLYKI